MRSRVWLIPACLFMVAAARAQQAPLPGGTPDPGSHAASSSEPPTLAILRRRYSESIAAADRAVTSQWIASLAALEKSRAAAGNYDGAERVRVRREEALSLAGSDDGRIPLRLSSSELTRKGSGLTVDEVGGTVMLRSGEAFLEWDISGDFKGWYEVRLTHGVHGSKDLSGDVQPTSGSLPPDRRSRKAPADNSTRRTGGLVSFQNVSNLKGNEATLRREIVSTGGWNAWRTVSLGKFEISGRGRIAKFRLTADEARPEGLMHFRNLELVPCAAPVPVTDGAARLAKAREVFEKEIRGIITASSATTRYAARLAALESEAVKAKDFDAQVRVREEKARLAEAPEKLALATADDPVLETRPITLETTNSFKCQFRGEVRPDSSRTSLTGLRPAGTATITWRLAACNVGSGTYDVAIKGRVPVNGGGLATLAAFGPANAAAGPVLEFKVKPVVSPEGRNKKPEEGTSPPAAENRTEQPGRIVIGKGAETLTLTVTGLVHKDGSLMDIASLTLTRTGSATPAKSAP